MTTTSEPTNRSNVPDACEHETSRKLRWYFISAALDFVGLSICLSILPFIAQELGATGLGVGMIFSAFSVGMAASGIIFGSIADARGRRFAVIVSTAATVFSYVLCGLADTYELLLCARVISGLAAGSMAVTNSVIIDLVPDPKKRPKYSGMLGACQGVAFFVGPVLAALFSPLGFNTIFFITAALSAIGLLGVCMFAEETMETQTQSTAAADARIVAGAAKEQPYSSKERWNARAYLPMVVMFLCSNSFAIMNATQAMLMQHNFGWNVVEMGMLMASVGAVQIFHQAVVVKRVVQKAGPACTLVMACTFLTGGMALYPFMPTWILSVAFFYVYMLLGFSFLLPVVPLLVAEMVPKKDTGKAMGMVLSSFAMGRISGPAMGGALWDVNIALPFWLGCALTTTATLLMATLAVRLDRSDKTSQATTSTGMTGVITAQQDGADHTADLDDSASTTSTTQSDGGSTEELESPV